MSLWTDINDAWMGELVTSVPGLNDIPEDCQHKYASWSPEQLSASVSELHIAVWPEGDAEDASPFTVDGGLLITQNWVTVIWEDASSEAHRQKSDQDRDAAWLDLQEAVSDRFLAAQNFQLGSLEIMHTRYLESAFDMRGANRVMALRFSVTVPRAPS